ncbi:dTDP-4-dehydrorhamnose 3,5-epimerase [Paenibacillus aceris]|uniref:dTDP-4-dehydrorhamnose 3,5-epimerase n=1 Tax=Paenibacillus aceris TaxID=869555 RepID=A0ABS4I4H1_9BACL|nr:dTDP-4-dehydrorhamnose 3,5-epimerase [Paenibacillus aceris]MBP1965815.1 dTDP-4-dehydrorhamnose 3,5-epimerase [Paenibacillus aceris]NHW34839.1 dTDP-4-dehydrorhamnose 3,5-epimerase [Paenibacillus aceris]
MILKQLELKGAYIIDLVPITDERGFFARTWCKEVFNEYGIDVDIKQCNISYNKLKGTLRGMHYQVAPYEEAKFVRVIHGAIYDVIIDLRTDSPTYMEWTSVELTAQKRNMLYIPEGFAHGFQTLEDDTEVVYQMGENFHPESARGIRWNDPAFNIRWKIEELIISEKDQTYNLW